MQVQEKTPLRPFVSLHIWRMFKWNIRDNYTNTFLARPCFLKNYKLCWNHFGLSYGILITVPRFYINSFLLAPLWFNTSNEWNSHTRIYIFFSPLEGTLAHVKWNLPSWPLWNLFSTPVTVLEYKRRIIEGSEPDHPTSFWFLPKAVVCSNDRHTDFTTRCFV